MTIDGLGPCDFTSVARHVATKLDKAAPAALAFDELAEGYHHANPADLSRVKRFCGLTSDAEAIRWLVEQAVDGLRPRNALCVDDGTVRLADGKQINNLTFQKRRVREVRDDHERLRDAFNPLSGEYSDNIRRTAGNLDDLRESMREFGWIKELPAIKDERGVVLVGHRRMAVAKELGIEPVITTIRCGDGDEGDARRFRLAIASNIGMKPFTPDERRKIAEYLYGEKGWSMARIGEALGVTTETASQDLRDFSGDLKNIRTEKRGRPKKNRSATPDTQQDAPADEEVAPEMDTETAELIDADTPVIPAQDEDAPAEQGDAAQPVIPAGEPAEQDEPAPPIPADRRRRRALPDAFADAVHELDKNVQKLARLVADDRFPANRAAIAMGNFARVRNVAETVAEILAAMQDETDQRLRQAPS